jgi:hypothetical protein
MIETGVASGKSTAMILLAMHHNRQGKLISIDLPNQSQKVLPDGVKTHTGNRQTGWLVPKYLRKRWQLHLGDSRELLPKLVKNKKLTFFCTIVFILMIMSALS